MEIIKAGNPERKAYGFVCRKCGCVAKFDETDIKRDRDGDYIICPSCGRFVSMESEYIYFRPELTDITQSTVAITD